jgi:hypothetical protein
MKKNEIAVLKAMKPAIRVLEDMAAGRVLGRDYVKVLNELNRQWPSTSNSDESFLLWHDTWGDLRKQILSHLTRTEHADLDRAMGWDKPIPAGYQRIRD